MAGTLKPVRFKRAWQSYLVGQVITPNGMLRDFLVANGFVEVVREVPQIEQTAHPKITREIPKHDYRKRGR